MSKIFTRTCEVHLSARTTFESMFDATQIYSLVPSAGKQTADIRIVSPTVYVAQPLPLLTALKAHYKKNNSQGTPSHFIHPFLNSPPPIPNSLPASPIPKSSNVNPLYSLSSQSPLSFASSILFLPSSFTFSCHLSNAANACTLNPKHLGTYLSSLFSGTRLGYTWKRICGKDVPK